MTCRNKNAREGVDRAQFDGTIKVICVTWQDMPKSKHTDLLLLDERKRP